jgi:hypothetical protein
VTRVIVKNVGDKADAINITGCTVLVRVDVMPPGGPGSVYDDGSPPCAAIVTRIDLAPGRADTLQRVLDFQTLGVAATSGTRLDVQARFAGLTLDGGTVTIP